MTRAATGLLAALLLAAGCKQPAPDTQKKAQSTQGATTGLGSSSSGSGSGLGSSSGSGSDSGSESGSGSGKKKNDDDEDEDGKKKNDDDEDDGKTGTGSLSTEALRTKVLAGVSGTPENSHLAQVQDCPAGYDRLSTFADCGNGLCNGNQSICAELTRLKYLEDDEEVIVDLKLTDSGAHVPGGGGCPSGYEQFMTVADCGYARCYGNQLFCKKAIKRKAVKSSTKVVTDVFVSPSGAHAASPTCGSGYDAIGVVADCGGGTCNGNQIVCIKREAP